MDNEQVRVCRCCGEAEVHMAACEERLKSDPLYAGGVVHEWQKQEMTASGAAMQRCKFVYLHSKTPPEVMASVGHASKQAMLDADQVNMARNDLIERVARATRCPSCGCYEGYRHHADCGSAEPHSLNDHPQVKPMPADPWAHRSAGMRCRTCMWYGLDRYLSLRPNLSPMREGEPSTLPEHGGGPQVRSIGRCRRHAPALQGFPVVFAEDWCGDHKLSEEAVR